MRRSVLAAALAAVGLFAACKDNTAPKANRSIAVAHVSSRSVGTTQSGATLTTDADDYAPGQTLNLTGAGWPAGDVVSIHLDESPQNHPPVDWTVTAGANGGFTDGSYVVQASDAGATFTITATSGSTGDVATASFTDTPLGAGSLCANVAGFGDAICPTANGAIGVLAPSHYKQKVGTAATYQIVGATDAFATGACAPNIEVTVRNTNATINSTICAPLVGSTITFSVQLPNDKCGTAAVSYSTHIVPSNANNDITNDGVKNGNATTLGGIAPTDASGNVIIPIQGVCPVQPPPPTASCVSIVAVQGSPITPVTMVGSGGTGGPYTFSATGLPAGVTMASNGTISGTPTVSGTFNYTVTVTDAGGHSGTVNCSVTVNPAPTASCVSIVAVAGSAITPVTMVGSGGTGGPYTFSATGLPAGVTMASDGTISGTPTVSGTFSYTVTVTDNTGHTGTINCSVTVAPPPTCNDPTATNFGGALPCEYPPPCPQGTFTYTVVTSSGDLLIKYDQFPAPNDNSYGVNAVGWGTKGHKFSDLTGSDHAGFQLADGSGVVRLSFNVDYISALSTAPSGYASLGVTGGDGMMLVGTAAGISATSSLANNLNNINIPGLFNTSHVQQFGSVNVLLDSPPTDAQHQTYVNSDPLLAGWDFHDTYYVTISAAKLASIGFDPDTWTVTPNASQLHNSPAKPCPTGNTSTFSITKAEVKGKEIKLTILNTGTTDAFLTDVSLTWPTVPNGKLMQLKINAGIVYDKPDIAGGSATLTTAQLVADQNKRKIPHGKSVVFDMVFEKNVDPTLSHYTGTLKFGSTSLVILPH